MVFSDANRTLAFPVNLGEVLDEAPLNKAMTGFWHFDAGAEAAAGGTSKGVSASSSKGYEGYKIAESGAVATPTIRAVRAKPL